MDAVLPRTSIRTTDAQTAIGAPLGSTRLFLAAESFRGATGPLRFRNGLDLSRLLERSGVGIPIYDAIDVALREGVPEVYLSRVVGDAAAGATLELDGPGGNPAVVLTVNEPGEWANGATGGLTGEVVAGPAGGGTRQVIIRRASTGREVTRSPVVSSRAALIAWNDLQTTLTVGLGTENATPAIAAPGNFVGGTSDSGAITPETVAAALGRFKADMGAGQVATPGRSTLETSTVVLEHARDFGRTGLLEVADDLDVGDVLTLAAQLRALGAGAEGLPRLGGVWAQHATGPSSVSGLSRTVPWTIVVAGLIARLERQQGHPNVAPFGDFGIPTWATGVTRYFDPADAAELLGAGVNIVEEVFNAPRNATFRTLEPEGATNWLDLAHTRTDRALHAIAADVGRSMGGRVIDRKSINEFGGKFRTRIATELWKPGALFGDTADEAARVDTDTVNDTASMAAREVNVAIGARMSEHAEYVNIDIAKVPIGQEV